MTALVAGQNIVLANELAYQIDLNLLNWQWQVIVVTNKEPHLLMETSSDAGIATTDSSLLLNLDDIDESVEKVIVYTTKPSQNQTTDTSQPMSVVCREMVSGKQHASLTDPIQQSQHQAIILLEVYRRHQQWKLRCVLQGYIDGESKLLSSFNLDKPMQPKIITNDITDHSTAIDVDDNNNLSTISLTWRSPKADPLRVFIGEKFKSVADIRLGCFYHLKNDQRGMVFSYGDDFLGSFNGIPYIQAVRSTEKHYEELQINSTFLHKMHKYLVFATLIESQYNWQELQVETVFQLIGSQTQKLTPETLLMKPVYAIGVIEFSTNPPKLTPVNEYFSDLQEMNHAFCWGLPFASRNNSNNEE